MAKAHSPQADQSHQGKTGYRALIKAKDIQNGIASFSKEIYSDRKGKRLQWHEIEFEVFLPMDKDGIERPSEQDRNNSTSA